jgi:hypothetical protein
LALLESSETDKFMAHLYQGRKQYRRVCERPNKGNKAVEREVISTYQIAQSFGFKGDFGQWEQRLLDQRPIAATSCGEKFQLARSSKDRRNIAGSNDPL